MNYTTLIQSCAPTVAPSTLEAIIRVESRGNPLAIHDNTTGLDYYPASPAAGAALVRTLTSQGHLLDVGLGQVDSENFQAYGLTPLSAFDACDNVRVAGAILSKAYRAAEGEYGPGQVALRHAFEAYNSGQLRGDRSYADRVLAAAGQPETSPAPVYHAVPVYKAVYWGDRYQPNW